MFWADQRRIQAFMAGVNRLSSRAMRLSAWTFLLGAVLLGGCPGDLDNPECFPDQSAPRCTIPDFDPVTYFADSCSGSACHGSDHPPDDVNVVDLVSDGVFERLTGQFASATACADIAVIDEGNWQNSFLIRKLRGQQGSCGDRMPYAGTLPEPELQCIGRWLVLGGTDVDVEMNGCVDRTGTDSGPRMDAGETMDAGVDDAGAVEDAGAMPDAGDDTGPAAIDCSGISGAGYMLCVEDETGCQAKTENLVSCDTVCATAGLVCVRVTNDDDLACAAGTDADIACDLEQDNMHNYCYCEPA